jgi:hypothetical protein
MAVSRPIRHGVVGTSYERGMMIEGLCGLVGRLFPKRRLLLCSGGRVRSISLSGWVQASALVVVASGIGGIGSLIAGYVHVERTLHHQSATMAHLVQDVASTAGAANDDLRRRLADANGRAEALSARYAQASARLDEARQVLGDLNQRLAAANSERETLKVSLTEAETHAKTLDTARAELARQVQAATDDSNATRRAEMEQTALRSRLKERASELQEADARSAQLKAAVDTMDRQLLKMAFERDRLRAQLGEGPSSGPTPISDGTAKPRPGSMPGANAAPAAPSRTGASASSTGELERLIASPGVDIDRLLGGLTLPPGHGGPSAALISGKRVPTEDTNRIADLQMLVKTLPLFSPLPPPHL